MENPKTKIRSAIEALKDIGKKLKMKRVRSDTCNLGTLREVKASVFSIELEAIVVNSEWDSLSEEALIKILKARFQSNLDFRFDEGRFTGQYKKKIK